MNLEPVVVDTNVLINAALNPNGTPRKAIQRGLGEPVRCGGSLRCSNWRGFPHERHSTRRVQSPFGTLARESSILPERSSGSSPELAV